VGVRAWLIVFTAGATVRAGAVPAPGAPEVARGWDRVVPVRNVVASSPVGGGGYPDPSGVPEPGTCTRGSMNSNRSESWLAVRPGTEDLVGTSKFFFDRFSTFYNFHLGSYTIPGGAVAGNNQVQGYECTTTGTQAMPPSWTNNTDPTVAFDTKGRAYQVTLPFNAFWTNLHPDGAIDLSYSDDLGRTWVKGNGGQDLEQSPNSTGKQSGHVEDKQWVAVNAIPGSPFQDHVYTAWAVFDGQSTKVRMAVSRDRGQSFDRAFTLSAPAQTGPAVTFVIPSVDAAGTVYASVVSFPPNGNASTVYVAASRDDARTWSDFVPVTTVGVLPMADLPNTRFRDGISESFAASPTHPGHLYLTYDDWTGTQFDVKFTQSVDGGRTWSAPVVVNDDATATDQFQPSIAAGPGGAVAIAFYDRRAACPSDPSVLPADVGRTNFCIDTTLQTYTDRGSGAVRVGANVRFSSNTWDPENPAQHVGGIGQAACATHDDPCTETFIGDYFGLAISATRVYGLFVSTHYPSTVRADEGGPVYYQQQVLASAARSDLGI
jgi:hypothetical protein